MNLIIRQEISYRTFICFTFEPMHEPLQEPMHEPMQEPMHEPMHEPMQELREVFSITP